MLQKMLNIGTIDQYKKSIEDIFKGTDLRPRTWENYRSVFYTTYQGAHNETIKI